MPAFRKNSDYYHPGLTIAGRYQVIEVIGRGAVGTVVRVSDKELGNEVLALKILHPQLVSDDAVLAKFQNEAAVSRQLSHPNIVRVYDFNQAQQEEHYFFSMEWVNGPNLAEYLELHSGCRIETDEASRILTHLTHGLMFAHRRGVIHRDIKPGNILLDPDGSAKLTDFGLAKGLETTQGLTATGESLGTPAYMSPEHFTGEEQDPRSDIYSLGILAYQLVVGKPPFDDDSYISLAKKHLSSPPPQKPLERLNIPEWYIELINRCTAKNKEERFSDCRMLLEHLRDHSSSDSTSPKLKLRNHFRRKRLFFEIFSGRQHRLTYIFFFLLALISLYFTFRETNPTMRLLDKIFLLEKSFNTELSELKSLLGFPDYSPLRPSDMTRAIRDGNANIIYALDRAGLDIHQKDVLGNTLLHYAAANDSPHLLPLLLRDRKLNLNAKNNKGETPLFVALKDALWDNALFLAIAGANPNNLDQNQNNALHLAAKKREASFIKSLLKKRGNQVKGWQQNKSGDTALHIAVKNDDLASVRALLENNIDPNVRDGLGRTPLMLALSREGDNTEKTINILLQHGADIQAKDNEGKGLKGYIVSELNKQFFYQALAGINSKK